MEVTDAAADVSEILNGIPARLINHDNQTGLGTTGKPSGRIQTLPFVQIHTSHGSHKHG